MVKVWSKTQHAIALSSAEAELYAAVLGAIEGLGLKSILNDMGIEAPNMMLGCDASAAISIISREGLGRTKHVDTQFLWVQEAVRDGRFSVKKIGTNDNPADLMTKGLRGEKIGTL